MHTADADVENQLSNQATILVASFALLVCACASSEPAQTAGCDLAIEHVNVIPMDSERVLADQTVLIAEGRITSIAPGSRSAARCNTRIDGAGRYLAPGLNDMHVHVEASAFVAAFQLPATPIPFEDVLFPYLANGVTGVRVMSGSPDLLAFRASTHGPAPRMMIASPMLSGSPPILPEPATRALETPEVARAAIAEFAAAGYDLIKIRGNISRPVLDAVLAAATEHGLDVDGHIPNLADWTNADVFSGRQRGIAHLDELALRITDRSSDPLTFARGLLNCHCYVTSTMNVEQSVVAQLRDYDAVAARSDTRFVHPLLRNAFWARERNPYLAEHPDPAFFDRLLVDDMNLARVFNQEGVTLLAGTDALSPMIIPGASMPDELALLVQAGLSPYDALRAATRTPAETFNRFADVGVLSAGRTANAILLRANPLVDINALRHPEGVILEGRYLDRASIDVRMEEIAQRFAVQ
jgi:cytosine/adenosine deaminase-related metal-dependent hydrolase